MHSGGPKHRRAGPLTHQGLHVHLLGYLAHPFGQAVHHHHPVAFVGQPERGVESHLAGADDQNLHGLLPKK